jgi:ADP-ribose pyrophosphatase
VTSNGDAGMKSEETLSSETVFEGRVIGLRVDAVRLPNGRSGVREVVEHDESVVIVPVTGDGEVLLVRQYRYPVGEAILEAPAGGVDAGETPHECARRELREETGYDAGTLQSLGWFWVSPGFCTEKMHAFLAADLTHSPLEPDEDEAIETVALPARQAVERARSGDLHDSKTIAALLMAAPALCA